MPVAENTVVNQSLKFNIWHIVLKKKYMKLTTPSVVKIKNTDGQNFKSRMILSDEVENQKKTKTGQRSHSLKWSKKAQSVCLNSRLLSSLLLPTSLNSGGQIKDHQRKLVGLMPTGEMTSVWQVVTWKIIEYSI